MGLVPTRLGASRQPQQTDSLRYILIPVKHLDDAKQRLSLLMSRDERTRLARLLLHSTFEAVCGVRNADRVAVVTSSDEVSDLANQFGFEVLRETSQVSESASVDWGSQEIEQRGALAALRLPIDLPLTTTEDIEQIIECDQAVPSAVIVPSRDGTGTNALLRRPPTLFPSHFGPGSLAKHLAEAAERDLPCRIIHNDHIALDIDDPSDLRELLQHKLPPALDELLSEMAIRERLEKRTDTN